jgi:putative ATP-dependent endonuclease of OLD family
MLLSAATGSEVGTPMKIDSVSVHNFRSFLNVTFSMHDYTMLVGTNNCGKSTLINAIRIFYDDLKWTMDDLPRVGPKNPTESWIEASYVLSNGEHEALPEKYHRPDNRLTVRKYLKSADKVKANQSNIYAYLPDGSLEGTMFFGARNISQAKLGTVIYVPALRVHPGSIACFA